MVDVAVFVWGSSTVKSSTGLLHQKFGQRDRGQRSRSPHELRDAGDALRFHTDRGVHACRGRAVDPPAGALGKGMPADSGLALVGLLACSFRYVTLRYGSSRGVHRGDARRRNSRTAQNTVSEQRDGCETCARVIRVGP